MASVIDTILAITTIIVPFFGGVFTIIGFYFRDTIEKEPKRIVLQTFLWGLLSGVIIVALTIPLFIFAKFIINKFQSDWAIILFMIGIVLIQAIYEETIKGVFLWKKCFCIMGEVDGLFDGFFYGAVIGTGAGIVDAIAYALLATDWLQGLEIALIRTIRIPGTHALFTGFLGMYCAWHKFKDQKRVIPGIVFAVILHTVWNVVTYIFHFYLTDTWFYIANFAFLGLYLMIMGMLSHLLLRYDKRCLVEGTTTISGSCEVKLFDK